MRLAYQVYASVAQQLQMAEAKVQEITPVYTIIEPATIPIKASKPRKAIMLLGIVFLTGLCCVGWVLLGRNFYINLKNRKEGNEINLKEDEIDKYLLHLQDILNFANIVNNAPVDGLSQSISVNENYNVFRKDEIIPFEDNKSLLENAPEKDRNML